MARINGRSLSSTRACCTKNFMKKMQSYKLTQNLFLRSVNRIIISEKIYLILFQNLFSKNINELIKINTDAEATHIHLKVTSLSKNYQLKLRLILT